MQNGVGVEWASKQQINTAQSSFPPLHTRPASDCSPNRWFVRNELPYSGSGDADEKKKQMVDLNKEGEIYQPKRRLIHRPSGLNRQWISETLYHPLKECFSTGVPQPKSEPHSSFD